MSAQESKAQGTNALEASLTALRNEIETVIASNALLSSWVGILRASTNAVLLQYVRKLPTVSFEEAQAQLKLVCNLERFCSTEKQRVIYELIMLVKSHLK